MKVKEPKVEIWEQPKGIEGIYKQIERAGRICYKSEEDMTEDNALSYVEQMIARKDYAILEHGTVYLSIPNTHANVYLLEELYHSRFTHWCKRLGSSHCINFSTNLRVLVIKDMWDACKPYVCDFGKGFFSGDRRVTVHFTTQIAISREANSHRVNSITEQSTDYCNYSKDKAGGSLAISVPEWIGSTKHYEDYRLDRDMFMELADAVYDGTATSQENWSFANVVAERAYMNIIKKGRSPQEACVVLPLDTQTELVHTAFVADWMRFFDLRAFNAHPDMMAIAKPLYEEFKKRGYIK